LNNAAYAGVLSGDRGVVAADAAAAEEALRLLPLDHALRWSLMNTRGLSLMLAGDPADGLAWCEKAMAQPGASPAHHAIRLASVARAAARTARPPEAGPPLWRNIAVPDTSTLAPASTQRRALVASTPPSTSTSHSTPCRSTSPRTASTFLSVWAISFWPPKPG